MPKKKKWADYGRDERHGRSGPEYSTPGDGFAENSGYTGSGYNLKKFRGQMLDKLSITEILDDEAGEETARKYEEQQELLSEMGFGTDGSTLK